MYDCMCQVNDKIRTKEKKSRIRIIKDILICLIYILQINVNEELSILPQKSKEIASPFASKPVANAYSSGMCYCFM